MTCASSGKVLKLKLTTGGDVKSEVVGGSGDKKTVAGGAS